MSVGSGAVPADVLAVLLASQPAAVMYQEAARTGELIILFRQHPDGELLTGQVGQVRTRQLEGLGELRLVDVDRAGLCLGAARLQFVERVFAQLVDIATSRRIVIGGHRPSTPRSARR